MFVDDSGRLANVFARASVDRDDCVFNGNRCHGCRDCCCFALQNRTPAIDLRFAVAGRSDDSRANRCSCCRLAVSSRFSAVGCPLPTNTGADVPVAAASQRCGRLHRDPHRDGETRSGNQRRSYARFGSTMAALPENRSAPSFAGDSCIDRHRRRSRGG